MIAAARIVSRSHCDSRSSGARMWFGNSRNGTRLALPRLGNPLVQVRLVIDFGPKKLPSGTGYGHHRILPCWSCRKNSTKYGGMSRNRAAALHNSTIGHHRILQSLFGKGSTKDGRAPRRRGASCRGDRRRSGTHVRPESAAVRTCVGTWSMARRWPSGSAIEREGAR